jgi:hypothetical protein
MNLDTIEITIDITQPPPWRLLYWIRFVLGLVWDGFQPVVVNCLYSVVLGIYKFVRGNATTWSTLWAVAFVGISAALALSWFRRKGGKDDITARQRWAVCSRLKIVAYEHGIEANELLTFVRGVRLVAARQGRFSYPHFREWHRASFVCRLGVRCALNDFVKRIGQEATERTIRRNGSLLLAIAKAAQ